MLGALNVRTQALLLTALVALVLAVVVWTRKERSRTKLPFSLVNLFVVLWAASYLALKFTGDHWFLRAFASAGMFLPPAYLYLTYSYLYRRNVAIEIVLVILFAAAATFAVTSFIPSIDAAMHLVSWFPPGTRTIRLAAAMAAIGAPSLALTTFRLIREPVAAMKRRYLGLWVASLATVTAGCADQAMGGGPLGPVALMLYHYYLFQSLVRYRAFSPGYAFGRVILLATSGMFLFIVYGLFVYFVRPSPILFAFHTLVVAFMLMVIYEPMFVGLAARAREWVVGERGELGRRIDDLLADLSETFSLEDIGDFLVRRVSAQLHLSDAAVYVVKDDESLELLAATLGAPPLAERGMLTDIEDAEQTSHSIEQLVQRASECYPGPERDRCLGLIQLMENCRGRWLIVMRHRGELVGLYVIAAAGLPDYGARSDELPAAIADQAAVRILNARIYQKLRAQDRMATLGQLAASLAHEIRNPLSSMKGAAQYLADEVPGGPAREFIDIILDEAKRLNNVLTRFLDYARPFALRRTETAVRPVVDSTLALLQEGEMPRDVAVRVEYADEVSAWSLDQDQLRQVLINLVKNAWQAQPGGGSIDVRVGVEHDALRIDVADRAPAIPAAERDKLFVPFFTTKAGGSGLGLPISLRIVQAHGGTLTAASREGGGNVFTLRIPGSNPGSEAAFEAPRADR